MLLFSLHLQLIMLCKDKILQQYLLKNEGFRARFQTQPVLCGGRKILNQNSISLSNPTLEKQSFYRYM